MGRSRGYADRYDVIGRTRADALSESIKKTHEKVVANVMNKHIPPIPPPPPTPKALWPGLNKYYDKSYNTLEGGDMAITATEHDTLKTLLETTTKTMTKGEREKVTEALIEETITKMALVKRMKNFEGA